VRSPTARLSALILIAIAAPAAVVAVLGYLSLRQWQVSAELLFREQARDVAVMAAQKVDMMLRHADDGFVDRLQLQLASGDAGAAALDRLVAETPLVRRLYLVGPGGRLRYPAAFRDEADAAAFGPALAALPPAAWERVGKRVAVPGTPLCIVALRTARREPVLRPRWPGWSRRRSWPCSTPPTSPCTAAPRSIGPSACWRWAWATRSRTGVSPCTRRPVRPRATSSAAR
jgi:hypothetical protein